MPKSSSTAADAVPGTAALHRWWRHRPLLIAGGVSVIGGGLAAAVTGPTDWDHGSWVAAFLVLVGGVAQLGIGAGQAHLAGMTPTAAFVSVQAALWNGGAALVIVGTLLASPVTVAIGSSPLVAVLVLSLVVVGGRSGLPRPVLLVAYRLLLLVLLVSVPIGIALAFARR